MLVFTCLILSLLSKIKMEPNAMAMAVVGIVARVLFRVSMVMVMIMNWSVWSLSETETSFVAETLPAEAPSKTKSESRSHPMASTPVNRVGPYYQLGRLRLK